MANLFDKMIEDLKKANGGEEDEIISALTLAEQTARMESEA